MHSVAMNTIHIRALEEYVTYVAKPANTHI